MPTILIAAMGEMACPQHHKREQRKAMIAKNFHPEEDRTLLLPIALKQRRDRPRNP